MFCITITSSTPPQCSGRRTPLQLSAIQRTDRERQKQPQLTVYITQCTLHSEHYTVYITQCTLHSVHYTEYIKQCTLHSVQYTVYVTGCTLHTHSVYHTVYITQCTLHNIHYTVTNSQCHIPPKMFQMILLNEGKWCFCHSISIP